MNSSSNSVDSGYSWEHLAVREVASTQAFQMSPMQQLHSSNMNQLGCQVPTVFSRRVFVGGIHRQTPKAFIERHFALFGMASYEWPGKDPKRGDTYVFVNFEFAQSVVNLVNRCRVSMDPIGLWYSITSMLPPVQIRPFTLDSINYFLDPRLELNVRKTVFVGGLSRTISATQLASIFVQAFGPVVHAGLDTDEMFYPKGAARVSFLMRESYEQALRIRYLPIQVSEKRPASNIEIKPYILADTPCEECFEQSIYTYAATVFCRQCCMCFCTSCSNHIHKANGHRADHIIQRLDQMSPCMRNSFDLDCWAIPDERLFM